MCPQHAPAETIVNPDTAAPTLRGRWLMIGRVVWVALVVMALGLFVASIPAMYRQLSAPPEVVHTSLAQLGLSVGFYATYLTILQVVFALGCFVVAAALFWSRSDEGMTLFVALFLVLLGAVNGANAPALKELHPALTFPVEFSMFLLTASLLLFLFIFPDGRFVPRWTSVLVIVSIVGILFALLRTSGSLAESPPYVIALILLSGAVTGVIAQIYRYARVSGPMQRQQTKWVVLGIVTALVGHIMLLLLAPLFSPSLTPPGLQATPYDLAGTTGVTLFSLLVPLSIGIAILKYRLYDIDLIINRTLVYGVLTACVIGLYVLVVGYLGALFHADGNLLISLVAAGLVAVLFAPLRDRLQRGVNRLMYGERDDPYAVISRLGERLEATLAPEAALQTIVDTVAQALKLPYAAITLKQGGEFVRAAEHGMPPQEPVVIPLTYQGEPVGQLILAPRSPGETFFSSDKRLLEDLARQAGVAVHAVRLTAELQHSREQLVTAREEERRRLRRDLHDGLGPRLAAQTLKAGSARSLYPRDSAAADALLSDLETDMEAAIAEVRRLVYDLRPPALDELGLVGAVREVAIQYESGGLRISVKAPERLPPLPAAVEVAAYRIATEALTNVVRHAHGKDCVVRLSLEDGMVLEVIDDGVGVPPHRSPSIGLTSMRERVEELGGSLAVVSGDAGGTVVRARLPLPQEPAEEA